MSRLNEFDTVKRRNALLAAERVMAKVKTAEIDGEHAACVRWYFAIFSKELLSMSKAQLLVSHRETDPPEGQLVYPISNQESTGYPIVDAFLGSTEIFLHIPWHKCANRQPGLTVHAAARSLQRYLPRTVSVEGYKMDRQARFYLSKTLAVQHHIYLAHIAEKEKLKKVVAKLAKVSAIIDSKEVCCVSENNAIEPVAKRQKTGAPNNH